MKSAQASEITEIINLWLETEKKEKDRAPKLDKIKTMLDANNFIFYFKRDNNIYAGPEESRVIFARMKNPEDDTNIEDVNFLAIDLDRALEGERAETIMYFKDVPNIKIINRSTAEKELAKRVTNPNKVKINLYRQKDEPDLEPGKKLGEK